MSSREPRSTVSGASEHSSASSAATYTPTAPEPQAREAAPWPLLCPTPDCNEHLRAHPHPSAPVLFAACGHSHCGLCAAVVLREPLPKCPTCGVGVGAGQASPNTGLGAYGEAVLHSSSAPLSTASEHSSTPRSCVLCAADAIDEPATYICISGSCDSKPLCCDHSRFHAKKTGHTPVCLEVSQCHVARAPSDLIEHCLLHTLPLSHYCMLHSELLCSKCRLTKHRSCSTTQVQTVQEAADHCTPALSSAAYQCAAAATDHIMLHTIPAIVAAKANMASRLQASISRFSELIDTVIAALHAHRSRVITAANLQCAEFTKSLDSQIEVMSVSASQLQAAVAMASAALFSCSPVRILGAHATVNSMAALLKPYDGPVIVPVVEVQCNSDQLLDKLGVVSKVVTGCGLKVTSVSGLELQPVCQQELRVVLSLEDGSAPNWIRDSDLESTVQGVRTTAGIISAAGAASIAIIRSTQRIGGVVEVVYELLCSDVQEVFIQLSVCGVKLGPAGGWQAHLRQSSHIVPENASSCAAAPMTVPVPVGECTHVCTLPASVVGGSGLAVSDDEQWLVVGLYDECTLSVYALPSGELARTFGGPQQFDSMFRLCFSPHGNLIVVEPDRYRLQEITLEGVFVRFIGQGVWSYDRCPWSVAVWNDIIAVGSANGTGPRVTLLGFENDAVTSQFGWVGTEPGRLSRYCESIRFTADGSHLVIAEREAKRLSLFTVGGVFVRCIGSGQLSGCENDVCISAKGEYIVADCLRHRVCVFSADGSELVRSWGTRGTGDGQFRYPSGLAIVGSYVYVLEHSSPRVQVFEYVS